jgi:hypothetical protein
MAKRRTLGRRLMWGILGYVVTSLGALATTWLTSLDVSPLVGSLLATGVGLVLVVIGVLMDHAQDTAEELPPAPTYPTPYPTPYQAPARQPVARRSIATVLVVILVLCGAGGWAVAYGAQWAGQRAIAFFEEQTKSPGERKLEDPGVERLGGTTSSTTGVLTLTVTSVRVNDQVTVLTVTASNQGRDPLTLPLFGSAQLTVPGAATLQPDPFVGTWTETIPAEGEATGTIVFDGVLGPEERSVFLSFTQIYGSLDGPRSISMEIPIAAAT